MPDLSLIDHSPHQPVPASKLPTASNLVLIDNYDSFTWNVYQYLLLEGATVTVYRNDKVTLKELIAKKPTQLVISPGPGHPDTDSGISKPAIRHFAGKIPIFGVCMGQQCIISEFGGEVDVTGEILHGKTSPLRHDGGGVYTDVPQDIAVTRYHSLAGTHPTLPPSLEVSSWIAKGIDGGKGVIMGVRHKEFVVEGVQFHPESILTETGRLMFRNFLGMKGGLWKENPQMRALEAQKEQPDLQTGHAVPKKENILDEIYDHRRRAVAAQEAIPSLRMQDLQASYNMGLAPPQISFPERLRRSQYSLALLAEVKRASPSKGDISLSVHAPSQARKYALAGASCISVLTEPEWFKGSIEDMRAVRHALESMPNRPAVLRKEFIFNRYQILEARLAGADSVLLIVKMLDVATLTDLYQYSQSLGMEPLVEVQNEQEMETALALGSRVIGVNNRDLTNFEVDLSTTSNLIKRVPPTTILCALSGIFGPEDVEAYRRDGVKGVLVGEALMRADDTAAFVATLLGDSSQTPTAVRVRKPFVKICGTRTPDAARAAVEAGASLVGIIRVPGRSRFVDDATTTKIVEAVRTTTKVAATPSIAADLHASDFFDLSAQTLAHSTRALVVGVYQNAPLEKLIADVQTLGLDVVQLHGNEPLEYARSIPVPVFRRFGPTENGVSTRGYHFLPLLDAGAGGLGERVDVEDIKKLLQTDPSLKVILAGGLRPENVADVLESLVPYKSQVVGVDVSSGVETDGKQDIGRIQSFLRAARA